MFCLRYCFSILQLDSVCMKTNINNDQLLNTQNITYFFALEKAERLVQLEYQVNSKNSIHRKSDKLHVRKSNDEWNEILHPIPFHAR